MRCYLTGTIQTNRKGLSVAEKKKKNKILKVASLEK